MDCEAEEWKYEGKTFHFRKPHGNVGEPGPYWNVVQLDEFNYGVITVKNMDWSLRQKFEAALQKGFVRRKVGCNGVKILSKYYSELKINGEARLMGSKIINGKRKILHVFDRIVTSHR
jgi:hypothetical protein